MTRRPGVPFILSQRRLRATPASPPIPCPPTHRPSWQDDACMQPRCTSRDGARRLVESRTGAACEARRATGTRLPRLMVLVLPGDHGARINGASPNRAARLSVLVVSLASVARVDDLGSGGLGAHDLGRDIQPMCRHAIGPGPDGSRTQLPRVWVCQGVDSPVSGMDGGGRACIDRLWARDRARGASPLRR